MGNRRFDRRDFVRMGVIAGGVAASGALAAAALKRDNVPRAPKARYRVLGRTKLKVSEISFGSYGFSQSDVLEAALDAGINFILTAGVYQRGNAERAIGKVLKKRRKEAVVMTGWIVRENTTKQQILEELDRSLERLQTDHIEIMRSHMVGRVSQLKNAALFEAFDEAKKAKKVSFLGLSTHGGELDKVLEYAVDSGKFDVLMFKYNFMEGSLVEKAIQRAAKKKLGVVVFKVSAGSREKELKDYEKEGLSHGQAAARWALKNPAVTSVIEKFSTFDDVRKALETMSKRFGTEEAAMLERYKREFWNKYCRFCGRCESLCPEGVAVAEVMRYHMYFKYYGLEKEAMELYAALSPNMRPLPCRDCPGWCQKGCPYGVEVRPQLVEAHELLSFTA